PFTRATGRPCGCVGAADWKSLPPLIASVPARTSEQTKKQYFIMVSLTSALVAAWIFEVGLCAALTSARAPQDGEKKGGTPLIPPASRLGGRDGQLSVHLVRFAAMALTAELRGAVSAGIWIVVAPQEESGFVVTLYAAHRSGEHVLRMLIMAARAGDRGIS